MRPKENATIAATCAACCWLRSGSRGTTVLKLCRTFDTRNGRDQEVMRQLPLPCGTALRDRRRRGMQQRPQPAQRQALPRTRPLCSPGNRPALLQQRTRCQRSAGSKSPVESFDLDNTTSYTRIEGIWYRLIFEYHGPDEIWKTYRFRDMEPGRPDAEYVTRTYGAELRHPGDVRHVYYREVPHLQRRPLAKGGKLQCGRKETEWVEFYLATGKLEMRSQIAENATMLRSRLVRARATRPPLNHAAAEVPAVSNPHLLAGHLPAPVPQRAAF